MDADLPDGEDRDDDEIDEGTFREIAAKAARDLKHRPDDWESNHTEKGGCELGRRRDVHRDLHGILGRALRNAGHVCSYWSAYSEDKRVDDLALYGGIPQKVFYVMEEDESDAELRSRDSPSEGDGRETVTKAEAALEGAGRLGREPHGHGRDPGTRHIDGYYRGKPAILDYNPETGLVTARQPNGDFISGWKAAPDQASNIQERGSLR